MTTKRLKNHGETKQPQNYKQTTTKRCKTIAEDLKGQHNSNKAAENNRDRLDVISISKLLYYIHVALLYYSHH